MHAIVTTFALWMACAMTGPSHADNAAEGELARSESAFYQGAYSLFFKTSDHDAKDDYAATSAILPAQGVNFYGYPAMTSVYVAPDFDGTGESRFEQMLSGTAGADLSLFGVLSETHLFDNYCLNYWLVEYLESIGVTTCNHDELDADPALLRSYWLESLKLGACWLSTLSASYPQLVGFTVDDFGYTVDAESTAYGINDQRYTVDQIDDLMAAAHCPGGNPAFKFWPTIYNDEGIARAMQDDSYYMQYDYASDASEDDWLAVNFYIPAIPAPVNSARLSFLYSDGYPNGTEADMEPAHKDVLFKEVRLNGQTLFSEDAWGNQAAEVFDRALTAAERGALVKCSSPAECARKGRAHIGNVVSVGLHVEGLTDAANKLAYMNRRRLQVWDFSLVANGVARSWDPAQVTFTKPDDGDPSCQDNDRDADGHSVGDGICDFITGRGSDYSIASHVSGAFLFFPADSKYFNAANYGKFLASARSALGSGDLIAGYYGDAFGESNLYPDVLQKEIDTARPYARGVLLWDPPLDLAQLDSTPPEGAFADVSAEITNYDHSSFWHGYNNGLRGWHQTFTHTGGQSGAITMTLHDVETAGTDGAEDNFYKTITDTDGHTYYRDGVDGIECTGTSSLEACPGVEEGLACMRICEVGDEHEYLTIDLGPTTTDLSVSMQLTDGVSNGYAGVATGWSVPDPAAWDYSTGVTETCYSLEYAAVLGAYAGVAHGPFNEDTDADGLHDCIDPEPTEANRWYWVNKDLASDCSAADHEAHTYEFVRGNAPPGGPGAPPASVPGVLKPGKAQAAVLTDCENPNSVSYGVYVEL